MERSRLLAWLLVLMLAAPLPATAQPAGTTAQPGTTSAFTPEQLEQVAAPIALYPDPLVAQVLMASTYPLEVVQAARFVKDNASLKGDQLNEKLKEQTWDDSVKSLVVFPEILALMDQKLDWVQRLGDAFLAQQKDLLDAIQRLRARAHAQGNLKSTAEQTVTVEPAPAAPPATAAPGQPTVVVEQPPTVITIAPTNPQVVYVPSYNPTVVYGAWPYPAYPPYYPYPPGYVFGTAALSFGLGMAAGAMWGNCNWGRGDVDVDVNNHNSFSNNVNRSDAARERASQYQQGQRGDRGQGGNRAEWKHSPENRKGVQYRDQATQQRYNRAGNPQAAQSREAYRGRAEQGRQDLGRGGAGGPGGGADGGARAQTRGGSQGREAGALQGVGAGGDAKNFSNRGQTSRQSSFGSSGGRSGGGSSFGASGGRSGGASRPSGGGGGRSGGGGRGGGGRR
ncbi:MAG TPA: DUF3300 domain-containing protein [Methylomirabilota bacterium]|nr:DUF3300 domain-containing protein [Methylomirabilota bacterium]